MVLSSVFYRGCFLLHLLDRRDYFLNYNPSFGDNGNQGSGRSGSAPVLHLGAVEMFRSFRDAGHSE